MLPSPPVDAAELAAFPSREIPADFPYARIHDQWCEPASIVTALAPRLSDGADVAWVGLSASDRQSALATLAFVDEQPPPDEI